MRKKKEKQVVEQCDKESKYLKNKYKNLSKNKTHNSILKLHENKLKELHNKDELLKKINLEIKNNNIMIYNYKKDIALSEINNNFNNDIQIKISKLTNENEIKNKEIEYITSNNKLTDYLLNTCNLIQKYIELEEVEKNMVKMSEISKDECLEQDLYDINNKKKDIVDEYMIIYDPEYRSSRYNMNNEDLCHKCNGFIEFNEGSSVCINCGTIKDNLHFSQNYSYKELQEIDYKPQFSYKKASHLEDWLRRFQAKENKVIPQEVLDKVILEAHKSHITDLNKLTEDKVKYYLKKLNLNEYYDNVISIINIINKRPAFVLTPEVETKIKIMFDQIQIPFEKYKDVKRKNMLSYSYVLFHFMNILGLPQFAQYFTLLKSPEKLRIQDEIFKKIVEELAITDPNTGWKFTPSI